MYLLRYILPTMHLPFGISYVFLHVFFTVFIILHYFFDCTLAYVFSEKLQYSTHKNFKQNRKYQLIFIQWHSIFRHYTYINKHNSGK